MALTSDRSICSSVGFISPASSARCRMTNDVSNLQASRPLLFKSRSQLCFFSLNNHRSQYDTLKNKIKGTASKNSAQQPIWCQAWWDQRNNNNYRHSTIRLQEIRIKGWESTMKTPVSQPWPSPPRSRSRVQMIAQLDEAVSINVRHCTSFSTADSSPFRKLQPRSKL